MQKHSDWATTYTSKSYDTDQKKKQSQKTNITHALNEGKHNKSSEFKKWEALTHKSWCNSSLAFKPTGTFPISVPLGKKGWHRSKTIRFISGSVIQTQFSLCRMCRPKETGASSLYPMDSLISMSWSHSSSEKTLCSTSIDRSVGNKQTLANGQWVKKGTDKSKVKSLGTKELLASTWKQGERKLCHIWPLQSMSNDVNSTKGTKAPGILG